MKFRLVISIFFVLLFKGVYSQGARDSVRVLPESSTIVVTTDTTKHSPKLAAGLSAILPGAGQVYNKKYWKVPVVYVGFAALIYGASYYNEDYHNFRSVYEDAKADTTDKKSFTVAGISGYTEVDLKSRRDFYRKYRDLCIIGAGIWYLLNIIDANVDAHFYDFDVSEDLSIQLDMPSEPQYPVEFAVRLRF